jgi:hypothetical protein
MRSRRVESGPQSPDLLGVKTRLDARKEPSLLVADVSVQPLAQHLERCDLPDSVER